MGRIRSQISTCLLQHICIGSFARLGTPLAILSSISPCLADIITLQILFRFFTLQILFQFFTQASIRISISIVFFQGVLISSNGLGHLPEAEWNLTGSLPPHPVLEHGIDILLTKVVVLLES